MKRLIAILLVVVMLTGCRLADENAGEPEQTATDRLAGVFITREYLSLFDMEGYLQDNWNGGEEIVIEGGAEYEGRIYAEKVQRIDPGGYVYYEYEFPELEGILMAEFLITPENGTENDRFWSSNCGEGINEIHNYFNTTDEGTETGIEATLYVSAQAREQYFYYNPVYQTDDGEVYLTAGTGSNYSPEWGGESTHTMTEERTVTEDGVTTVQSSFAAVTVDAVEVPVKVILIQMDANHLELARMEAVPGQMPDALTVEAECAYIVVAQILDDGAVIPETCQAGQENITVYYDRGDGICIPDGTEVTWPEA